MVAEFQRCDQQDLGVDIGVGAKAYENLNKSIVPNELVRLPGPIPEG